MGGGHAALDERDELLEFKSQQTIVLPFDMEIVVREAVQIAKSEQPQFI
jgi:hypothetical protein